MRLVRAVINEDALKFADAARDKIAESFGVRSELLTLRYQYQDIVRPRHALCAVLRFAYPLGSFSTPAISRYVCRERTTILSSLRRASALLHHDADFKAKLFLALMELRKEWDTRPVLQPLAEIRPLARAA